MFTDPEPKHAPAPSGVPERFHGLRRGLLAASKRFDYQTGARSSVSASMSARTGGPLTIGRRFNPGPGANIAGLSAARPGRVYTLYFLRASARTANGLSKPAARVQLETDILVALASIASSAPQQTREGSRGLGATPHPVTVTTRIIPSLGRECL